jgi:ubiquinone/menaquinone biosynthesis C-methylase UbiE
MKPYRWADGPERQTASDAPVVNPFVGRSVATRYAEARPGLHDRVVALLAERLPTPERALDLGCGTGLSTRPLASFARVVVGVDVSEEMLRARSDTDACYVRAQAERLPFRDRVFDLTSIASAIHWFAPEAVEEVGRVLRSTAWLVVYDVWFRAQMVGVHAFGEWMRSELPRRYPSVQKNEFTQASLSTIGLAPAWEEDLEYDVSVTLDALVAYLMTHSERIAAVTEGRETEAEQRAYLVEGVGGFFSDAVEREIGFGVRIETFKRGHGNH